MKVILIGAPACGKGTQAKNIVETYGIPHISTGDMFRAILKEESELSKNLKSYMDEGKLVPDSIVMQVAMERLNKDDCKKGFLLDGFPRTLNQAKEMLKYIDFDIAIFIEVEYNSLVKRIANRLVCDSCGKIYNMETTTHTKCSCEGNIIKRKDDTEEIISKRIEEFKELTYPVVDYFKSLNKLTVVDGNQTPEQVFADIKEVLKNYD